MLCETSIGRYSSKKLTQNCRSIHFTKRIIISKSFIFCCCKRFPAKTSKFFCSLEVFKMAVTYGQRLYFLFNRSSKKNILLALGYKVQHPVPQADYSTAVVNGGGRRSFRAYLERVAKSNEFIKQQLGEYELGKKFLAGMMGRKSGEFTQKDIDDAIEYLFPSALFVPKARPMMKQPAEIFTKQCEPEYDRSGRPHHYLFYTLKPNFSQCLHDAAETLERLNALLYKKKPPKALILAGGRWLSQAELTEKFNEKLYDLEYEKFLEVFKKLAEHPFAHEAETFIRTYWKTVEITKFVTDLPTIITQDNITVVTVKGTRRKTSCATVSVSHPGSGKIRINNLGIDYFISINPREQLMWSQWFDCHRMSQYSDTSCADLYKQP